jgi:DNA-directed RNA polymerase III subunit RPC6
LTKTLKILEQRLLIKSVRSVVSKSKKLYVLYDVVPAKSVTGGPWYSDQEFDHEFVAALSDFIVSAVDSAGMMDQASIADKIRTSGVSNVSVQHSKRTNVTARR